jgi:hypothetical protein
MSPYLILLDFIAVTIFEEYISNFVHPLVMPSLLCQIPSSATSSNPQNAFLP